MFGDESAADMKQLTAATGIGPAGALVLTGSAGKSGTSAFDALLLSLDVTSLVPMLGRQFGDHAARREQGLSLFQVPAALGAGFIISGISESDPAAVGDARDLYLVRTDNNGATNCTAGFAAPHVVVAVPPATLNPIAAPILTLAQRAAVPTAQNTRFQRCP